MNQISTNTLIGLGFNFAAYALGFGVYLYEAKRRGMNRSMTTEVALVGVLVGVVFATLAQIAYSLIFPGPEAGTFAAGRTIVGGVLGGWVGVEVAKRRLGIKQSTGPLWALALPAGETLGRIGCWFHGCCHGKPSDLPWAVFQHDAMRHPTQFYLSFAALATFIILWLLKDKEGLFYWAVLLWCISRIIIEPLRESSSRTPWLVPVICAAVGVFCIYKLVFLWRNPKLETNKTAEPVAEN